MTRLPRLLLAVLAALGLTAAVAVPALAGPTVPAQTASADARVCAALTVDGLALLRGQPAVSRLLAVTPGVAANPTPAQLDALRTRIGCGPAPTGQDAAAVRAAVCAALDVSAIRQTIAAADLQGTAAAIADGADGALPTIVGNAAANLNCPGAGTVTPTPSVPLPDDGTGSTDGTGSGAFDGTLPLGAPETGA